MAKQSLSKEAAQLINDNAAVFFETHKNETKVLATEDGTLFFDSKVGANAAANHAKDTKSTVVTIAKNAPVKTEAAQAEEPAAEATEKAAEKPAAKDKGKK